MNDKIKIKNTELAGSSCIEDNTELIKHLFVWF